MPLIRVCVRKIVNLATKMTKDMPIMKSAFPNGSGVQTHCCSVQPTGGPRKTETKGKSAYLSRVFAFFRCEIIWQLTGLVLFFFSEG